MSHSATSDLDLDLHRQSGLPVGILGVIMVIGLTHFSLETPKRVIGNSADPDKTSHSV